MVACGFGKLVIESKILGEVIDPILLSLAPLQDQLVKFNTQSSYKTHSIPQINWSEDAI